MKMMNASTYTTYSRVLRLLRGRGDRLDFLRMGVAADLAMAIEDGEQEQVAELAARLELDLEALAETVSQ